MTLSNSVPSEYPSTDTRAIWFCGSLLGLVFLATLALRFGFRPTDWATLWSAVSKFDPTDPDQIVLRVIRLPRLIGAVLAGVSLGVAGALMQGMTRNPLADPGILGINAGASIGVVICIMALGITDPAALIWVALAGALVASVMVFLLAGGAQANPARLVLAGAAVSALFLALSRSVLLVSQQTLEVYRYWVLGGFDGLQFDTILTLLPFFAVGILIALIAAFVLNALMLGEDVARSLGVQVAAHPDRDWRRRGIWVGGRHVSNDVAQSAGLARCDRLQRRGQLRCPNGDCIDRRHGLARRDGRRNRGGDGNHCLGLGKWPAPISANSCRDRGQLDPDGRC